MLANYDYVEDYQKQMEIETAMTMAMEMEMEMEMETREIGIVVGDFASSCVSWTTRIRPWWTRVNREGWGVDKGARFGTVALVITACRRRGNLKGPGRWPPYKRNVFLLVLWLAIDRPPNQMGDINQMDISVSQLMD